MYDTIKGQILDGKIEKYRPKYVNFGSRDVPKLEEQSVYIQYYQTFKKNSPETSCGMTQSLGMTQNKFGLFLEFKILQYRIDGG